MYTSTYAQQSASRRQRVRFDRQRLLDPCINTHVGAWILAQNIRRHGYGWDAVGAYNARSPVKRNAYAHRVAARLRPWRS